ncbi:MAG: hypothetical protein HYV17_08785 [Xanthomonadales bacterium]|nr:hypothetical protein [Xanthomonadales bacterium]
MSAMKDIFGVALSVLLIGCQHPTDNTPPAAGDAAQVATTSTGEMFYLEPDELDKQMMLAKQGDTKAAMRVAGHYSLGENDTKKSLPWLTMAAENGDIVAMQNIASSLSMLGGKENCQAALDWFERAKREKSPEEIKEYGIDDSIARLKAGFDECVKRSR